MVCGRHFGEPDLCGHGGWIYLPAYPARQRIYAGQPGGIARFCKPVYQRVSRHRLPVYADCSI